MDKEDLFKFRKDRRSALADVKSSSGRILEIGIHRDISARQEMEEGLAEIEGLPKVDPEDRVKTKEDEKEEEEEGEGKGERKEDDKQEEERKASVSRTTEEMKGEQESQKTSREPSKRASVGSRRTSRADDDDDEDKEVSPEEAGVQLRPEEEALETKMILKIRSASMGLKFPVAKEIRKKPFMGSMLENHLTEHDLEVLMEAFEDYPEKEMRIDEFRDVLLAKVELSFSVPQLEEMFTKMDTDKNGKVGWNEFLSYVLLEIQARSATDTVEDLVLPLSGQPRVLKSRHRFPIVRVAFFPVMQPDRTTSFLIGRYATISRDGRLNYWTLDFELEGTASAATGGHRITETWITDMVCMPDASIVCVSNTNKDLNFFDTTAKKFELRLTVSHLPQPVVVLHYYFYLDADVESQLVCGDLEGNVLVFTFQNYQKGPFQYTHSNTNTEARLDQVAKGFIPKLSVRQFLGLHSDVVKQVGFFSPTRSAVSCAATNTDSLALSPLQEEETHIFFNYPRGVTCFVVIEEKHMVVMGCMSGAVLAWDVYVVQKASFQLIGHNSPVITVVSQDEGRRVYSMARDRSIKCWDVTKQKCLQTYLGVPAELGATMGLSFSYNEVNRNLVIASTGIGILVLGAAVDQQRCDGYTHTMGVVRVLYNPLYKCVITVGMDSVIMVWDIWEGKRMLLIRDAHTRSYYGVPTPMEITAATFDPAYQYLITGARDGSVKIWNFNMGYCVRSMNIEPFCEVTGIVWMPARILTAGWDRHVTEFSDEDQFADSKVWETRHTEDILCMAIREGQSIATSSYNGELILWRAETGRAYRRYNVSTPRDRIILTYTKEKPKKIGRSHLIGPFARSTLNKPERPSIYQIRKDKDADKGYGGLSTYKPPGETKDFVLGKIGERRRSSLATRGDVHLPTRDPTASFTITNMQFPYQKPNKEVGVAMLEDDRRKLKVAQMAAAVIESEHPQLESAKGSRRSKLSRVTTKEGPDDIQTYHPEDDDAERPESKSVQAEEAIIAAAAATKALAAVAAAAEAAQAMERRASLVDRRSSLTQRGSITGRRASSDAAAVAAAALAAATASFRSVGSDKKQPVRRVSVVKLPGITLPRNQVYVSAMTFLNTRPMLPDWGTLFVGVDKGLTQVWSHHPAGCYMGSFLSIHMAGDYVTAMTSDEKNEYLITGTSLGYIKIWLMTNFAFPEANTVKVCMPKLRLQFPFLWKDRAEGRAKRSLRDQPLPLLLSSYRGHLMTINSIEYMNDYKLLLTASADTTVRMWSLSGLYLGTLGGLHKWTAFREHIPEHEGALDYMQNAVPGDQPEPTSPSDPDDPQEIYRIPADIKLVMSSTTMKVLMAGNVPHTHFKLVDDSDLLRDLPQKLLDKATYGKRPSSPLLGKYIDMPQEEPTEEPPYLNVSSREIPVYSHLHIGGVVTIKKPKKPHMLTALEKRQKSFAVGKPPTETVERARKSVRSFIGSFLSSLASTRSEGSRSSIMPNLKSLSSQKGVATPPSSNSTDSENQNRALSFDDD